MRREAERAELIPAPQTLLSTLQVILREEERDKSFIKSQTSKKKKTEQDRARTHTHRAEKHEADAEIKSHKAKMKASWDCQVNRELLNYGRSVAY